MIRSTGRRVTRKASSAGVDAHKAEARSGPQGVEAQRLASVDPALDERFGAIKSRDEQPRAAHHALLLNRRLGAGAPAAEEERAKASGWQDDLRLSAMAPLPAQEQCEWPDAIEQRAAAEAARVAAAVKHWAEQLERAVPAAEQEGEGAVPAAELAVEAAATARARVEDAAVQQQARVGDPEWEVMEVMRERGDVPDEQEEARAFASLLLSLRSILGVRRMPRLSESEGYAPRL